MKQLHPKAVWLFFFSNIISSVFCSFFLAFFSTAFFVQNANILILPIIFVVILVVVIVLSFVFSKLTFHFYKYELTDIGFKKEHGIIWKKYVTIPYDRIQNVDIYRGVFARILGLSDLQIQTAGAIVPGSYGAFSEGRLPGLSKEDAEILRDELVMRARERKSNQGL